jgi:hypothetical protein
VFADQVIATRPPRTPGRVFLLRTKSDVHELGCLAEACPRTEAQCIHGADCHTDAAADTGAVRVGDGVFFQSKAHDVDADLAVARTFVTADALVVRDNLETAPSKF